MVSKRKWKNIRETSVVFIAMDDFAALTGNEAVKKKEKCLITIIV